VALRSQPLLSVAEIRAFDDADTTKGQHRAHIIDLARWFSTQTVSGSDAPTIMRNLRASQQRAYDKRRAVIDEISALSTNAASAGAETRDADTLTINAARLRLY
jgi:hypothetical protein